MGYSGAGGKLIPEKNQKQKISWHCLFKCSSVDTGQILSWFPLWVLFILFAIWYYEIIVMNMSVIMYDALLSLFSSGLGSEGYVDMSSTPRDSSGLE